MSGTPVTDVDLLPEEILGNPGLLKLELMTQGVRIDPASEAALRRPERLTGAFGGSRDIDMVLPGDTWVSVPAAALFTRRSSYELAASADGGHEIRYAPPGEARVLPGVRVQVQPPSPFYEQTTQSGTPLGRLGTIHGSYLALSPTSQCAFLSGSDQCRFCSLATSSGSPAATVEDIIDAVRVARDVQRVDMVYLSVGYAEGEDSGVRLLEPYIRAIKRSFDVLVAVDALPPAADAWVDRTYAMGADSISYNLEIFDPELFRQICPGPARAIGRERFLDALAYATTVFPSGAVVCHLIVGLEPIASTLEGIDALTTRKVVPVLPIYRPFKGIDMRTERPVVSTAALGSVYGTLYKALRREKINMSWVRPISVVTTPMEGRFFVEGEAGLQAFLKRLVGGRDRKPSVVLSDWRRALRVKEVDDSLKSSGL